MASRWGMDQGFQEYFCRPRRPAGVQLGKARQLARRWDRRRAIYDEMPYFTAPEMTRAAISWLERHGDTPFFHFLNYMDVHSPNAAPGTQGLPFEDESVVTGPRKKEWLDRYLGGAEMTPSERRSFVNEYDRELIHLDRWVGALLDHLESSGLGERTMVVLTSDHGEFLDEHHLIGHSKDLYAEVVDIPMIVWEPGAASRRVSHPVQGLDVFPTILRYLGLPIPPATQGHDMLQVDHPIVSEEHYALTDMLFGPHGQRFDRILRTIRAGEHRYFQSTSGEERLFDRQADPREARNLASERPDLIASARASLEQWLRTTPEAAPRADTAPKVDAEALENLRALGYIR